MYILETNSFKYYLGERLLFKLPALKLHTKSRIGLIGLNGSGKTTLLELLAGIRPIPAAAKIICKITMITVAIKINTLQKRRRNDSTLHPAGTQTTIRFAAGIRTNQSLGSGCCNCFRRIIMQLSRNFDFYNP